MSTEIDYYQEHLPVKSMIDPQLNEYSTTLRWYLTNEYGNPMYHGKVMDLIDKIVGYNREPSPPEVEGAFKVALVVGHNAKQKGAFAEGRVNQFEYDFNNQVANEAVEIGIDGVEMRRFNRVFRGSYSTEIDEVYGKVDEWGADFVVEMHFNSGGGNYCTMLHAESSVKSKACAQIFQVLFSDSLLVRNYGLMGIDRNGRGGRSLFASKAPTVLTEPFFGDNPEHQEIITSIGTKEIAKLYNQAIAQVIASVLPKA